MNVRWLPGWKKSVEKTQSPHLSYFVKIFKLLADTPLSEHVWGWVVNLIEKKTLIEKKKKKKSCKGYLMIWW